MSERQNDTGLTSGDPLAPGDDEPPRHESGLPGYEPPRPAPPAEHGHGAQGGFQGGYSSPPPPGAGGLAPTYTAAAPAGRYVLAGWWSRAGAQLIDGLILTAGWVVIMLIFASVFSIGFFDDDDTGTAALVVSFIVSTLAFAIVALLYAPLMMARTNGKTLGRMATGIRVVRANGKPMTFGFAMLREVGVKALLFGFAGSITFGLANLADYLWPLWDDENRALHDFIVDSRVVKD